MRLSAPFRVLRGNEGSRMPSISIRTRKGQTVATALVDTEYLDWLSQWEWRLKRVPSGLRYAQRVEVYDGRAHCIFMHREIMHLSGIRGIEVDHINGDGLNNRTSNLRVATHAQNQQNKKASRNSTSRFRGVFWDKRVNKWAAQCKLNGQRYRLGWYDNEQEAARVAADWRRQHMPFTVESRLAS